MDSEGAVVIDYSLPVAPGNVSDDSLTELGKEIYKALECDSVLFLKIHGIDEELVEEAFAASRMFFDLPVEVKRKYQRPDDPHENNYQGWLGVNTESVNLERPPGLKESFNYTTWLEGWPWPDEVPSMKPPLVGLALKSTYLGMRVLEALALALGLNRDFFKEPHKSAGTSVNMSTTRLNYYPAVADEKAVLPNQIRVGEHADFPILTILFQDNEGGLEVHRVVIPDVNKGMRLSIANFITPDNDYVVHCLDPDKYRAVNARDFITGLFDKTY